MFTWKPHTISASHNNRCVRSLMLVLVWVGIVGQAAALPPIVGVGTFDHPPYQYLDSSGEPSGFDVDVFKAAVVAAGMTPHIRIAESRSEQLSANEVMLGTSYAVLEERRAATLPYARTQHTLYANNRSLVRGIEDLRTKQIVVNSANLSLIDYLERHGYRNQLTLADSADDALSLIGNERVEVAILDAFAGGQVLKSNPKLDAAIREVEDGIAPTERTFSTSTAAASLRDKLERGFRTTVRTGQYDRTLLAHLGAAANSNKVTLAGTTNVMTTVPLILAVALGLVGLVIALRLSEFKGRAMNKLRSLEKQLVNENEVQQELRLALARQQFVLNRISTTNLVDVIKKASHK